MGKAHHAAADLKDFYAGLSSVLEGMLVDPMVLMIVDTTEPDPAHPGKRRLDAFSMASRLSFFLWNSAPDDAVLKAAESGEIQTPAGRARVVDMMLASPRLENGVRAFFDDMFAFDDFDTLSKDASVYPKVSGTTLKDAREQTLRTVYDHLITRDRDYRDLFTTRDTFISPSLAAVYSVPAVPGWVAYEFPPDSPRVGILSQVSFLAVHSHPGRSSPTLRGKALREVLLCQKVPSPPPNVDFSIVEDPKANFHTARERLTAHRSNPVCAGCHRITDPIGPGVGELRRRRPIPAHRARRAAGYQRHPGRQGFQGPRGTGAGRARSSRAADLPGEAPVQLWLGRAAVGGRQPGSDLARQAFCGIRLSRPGPAANDCAQHRIFGSRYTPGRAAAAGPNGWFVGRAARCPALNEVFGGFHESSQSSPRTAWDVQWRRDHTGSAAVELLSERERDGLRERHAAPAALRHLGLGAGDEQGDLRSVEDRGRTSSSRRRSPRWRR